MLTGVQELRVAWEQPQPPEQAWPALIRSQAPTLAITRPSLQQPAIADCFAPVGAADTGNVPRKTGGHSDVPNL